MKSFREPYKIVALVFWTLAVLAIPIWFSVSQPGWDARVYARAMHWVAAGQDPYQEGIAQEEDHYLHSPHPGVGVPFAYVYSPMTLPLLKLASYLPPWLLKSEYWLLYALCALIPVIVSMRAAEGEERKWISLLAPIAIFFPGLLVNDVIQSGNLAYIVYGLVLATAWAGWRRGLWLPFYVVVLAASCFKAPYLSLLAIPFFSARRQCLPAAVAGAAGVALFVVQLWLWPSAFQNYLRAVELQFVWNRDFGSSPAGQFGALLEAMHLPFETAGWIFYFCYALPICGTLLVLGRRYQRGLISLGAWMPIVIVGTVLLNPRHIEYDLAPLMLPMALIVLRLLGRLSDGRLMKGLAFEHFVGINAAVAVVIGAWWRPLECVLLATIFAGGCWDLVKKSATVSEKHEHVLDYAGQKLAI